MSDEVKQTVPGQGVGTPEAQVSAQVQSQDAVTPGQEPASQQGTEEAKPVTAQDLRALEEKLAKQIQSQVDKSSTRVMKAVSEVEQAVSVLRASGREITDADVQTLKQNAAAKAMIETEPGEVPEGAVQPDPLDKSKWDSSHPVSRKVIELELQYGVDLKDVKRDGIVLGKGELAFVKSVEEALKAASGQKSTSTETKPTVPPAARIPATGTPTSPRLTPDEKLAKGLEGPFTGKPPGK